MVGKRMNGWVKDWKSTLEWGWFTDVPTAHFWEYVRLKANWDDVTYMGETIKKGSFASSVERMAIESGLTPKQVRLAISKLEKTGEITVSRTNRYTVITVVKWAEYQGSNDEAGKPKDMPKGKQKASTREDQKANEGNPHILEEEEKKRRRKNKRESTKERKPSLDEVRSYCQERRNGVDPDKWYDYYSANGWKVGKNPMKDWKASVRTWERKHPKTEETVTRYEQPW